MRVDFQSMNPSKTDDSFLLRFEDSLEPTTRCILVDCGEGVNVDQFLRDEDELVAIIITHAHEDHISSLPENARPNVPIYATPGTATILTTLFNNAASYGESNPLSGTETWPFWQRITEEVAETVTNAVTPITELEQVTPHVDIIPLPAGHAPGAASFLFKIIEGDKNRYMLATGDFTTHTVAGNRGITGDIAKSVNIDAVFINSPVRRANDYNEMVSESLGRIIEYASQGKKVLTTASSLTGVHYAYWLDKISQASSVQIDITLVGLSAKLYRALGYEATHITLSPTYQANNVGGNGEVVITAPEVPTSGGSAEIYNHVKDDPNAMVIQIKSGGEKPSGNLDINHSYRFTPHPTQTEIDEFIESLNPKHMIVNHGKKDHFKRRYEFTIHWTIGDHHKQNKLLKNGEWVEPEWMSASAARKIVNKNASREQMMPTPVGEVNLPSVLDPVSTFADAGINEKFFPDIIDFDSDTSVESQNPANGNPESNRNKGKSDVSGDQKTAEGEGVGIDRQKEASQAEEKKNDASATATVESPQSPIPTVRMEDGGTSVVEDASLIDPDDLANLSDQTTTALLRTLTDIQSFLDRPRPTGTVVGIDGDSVTLSVDGELEKIEEGDTITVLPE